MTDSNGGADGSADPRSLAPDEALSETVLNVRYGSDGPTSSDLSDSDDRPTARFDRRFVESTGFDAGAVSVDGEPFASFLHDSVFYTVGKWAVAEFPPRLRETGTADDMSALYEGLLEVVAVRFHADVWTGRGGERERTRFDVQWRNRNGEPVAVAMVTDSREPLDGERLESFLADVRTVAAEYDSLVGAFAVTTTFFTPEAIEAAETATTGGRLLGRFRPTSYVRLGRDGGFHLCLAEARDGDLYVAIPEL